MLTSWQKSAAEAGYGEDLEVTMGCSKDRAEMQVEVEMWTIESQSRISSH